MTWPSKPREGLAVCRAKGVPSFPSYFKTLSDGPVPGFEPATSRPAVKCSTDCACTVAVKGFTIVKVNVKTLSLVSEPCHVASW